MTLMKDIEPSNKLVDILSSFDEDQLKIIMKNVAAIQLTEGCNTGCDDCGLEAVKGVKDYLSFDFLTELVDTFGSQLNNSRPALYYASEPFDYDDGMHNYFDVHKLFRNKANYPPVVITSLAKGKEKLMLDIVVNQNNHLDGDIFPFVYAISLMPSNVKRFHNTMIELIPGLAEDEQSKVNVEFDLGVYDPEEDILKSRLRAEFQKPVNKTKVVTISNLDEIREEMDSPNAKIFQIDYPNDLSVASNSDKLLYTGESILWKKNHSNSYNAVKMPNGELIISEKTIGVPELIYYFNSRYRLIDSEIGEFFSIRNYVYEEGIFSLERLQLGEKNKDSLSDIGIGCMDGVLLTPSGVFNLETVEPTKEYPTGQVLSRITKENFFVVDYEYII